MCVGVMGKEVEVKDLWGLSLMPLKGNSKRPPEGRSWKQHSEKPSSLEEVNEWLEEGYSLGCVCGKVSGGLLVLDFDKQDYWPQWCNAVGNAFENPDFWKVFPVVRTKKGTHLYLRCDKAPASEVLSRDADNKIIIETRGEGGYVVFPEGHPDYELQCGSFEEIPVVDAQTLDFLLGMARVYDCKMQSAFVDQEHVGKGKPGDDYANRTDWEDILGNHGWAYIRTRPDGVSEWTRPGKDFGLSATTGIHGSDLLYVFTSNAFPLEAGKSYSKFAFYTYVEHGGDFAAAASELRRLGFGDAKEAGSGPTVSQVIFDLGQGVTWYEDGNSDVYVRLPESNSACQVVNGECPDYAKWIEEKWRESVGGFPSEKALKEAIIKLERHSPKTMVKEVPLRVQHAGDVTYVDTGNKECVVIKPGKVLVEPLPENRFFKRPQGFITLNPPASGGSLDTLEELINYKEDKDWYLILGWITACIGMGDATFPIMTLAGPAGAAKTTGTQILRSLVDPAHPALLPNPRSTDALYFQSVFNYVMAYDNLSGISNEVSDALCTLVSGTGFVARKLYTNLGRVALTVKRPVLLNGIDNVARRNDFASRTLFVQFAKIPKGSRLNDLYVAAQVEKNLDKWRGICYNVVSEVKKVDRTSLARPDFRLADYSGWTLALGEVMGWKQSDIMASLEENEAELLSSIRESDLVAVYLEAFMERRVEWEGSSRELYETLVAIVPPDVKKSKDWPDTLNGFGMRLNRAAPTLESAGIFVTKERTYKGTVLRIVKRSEDNV